MAMMAASEARTQVAPDRAERFAERMVGILNGGALALMVSIGHRTGLFDVMARTGSASSAEVARAAGLDERYVREWLGAMVTGGLVELAGDGVRYRLPAEHAACLTRASRPNNLATSAQWIPLLGQVEDAIVACFARGGGVPYAAFERFHAVMAEESDQSVVAVLLDRVLPQIAGLRERLEQGIHVLDVGCGRGRALLELARAHPRSRFTGFDLSQEAVLAARAEAERLRLSNAAFEVRDVGELQTAARFDLVTAFDAIHDQARPAEVLAAISRALRPGGVFLMQEIAGTGDLAEDARHPLGPFLYTVSCMHCMTVSLAARGAGLGAMWGERLARRMLAEAGFVEVEVQSLPHDVMNRWYVARRAAGDRASLPSTRPDGALEARARVIFRFGPYELDEDAGELRRDGEVVELQPKPYELLRLLVRERHRVVPLDELFARLWPGVAVTPSSLTRAMSHARRAIGDTHRGEILRSHARRGYRFVGDVEALDATPGRSSLPPQRPGEELVGREDALAPLRERFEAARAGDGGLALVSGPPGIGKSRLVERLAEHARASGAQVLIGRAREGAGVPPFWPWVEVLRELLLADRDGSARARVEGSAPIRRLLPELGGDDAAADTGVDGRFLLFDAVARALVTTCRERPLLVVLEDLQWAGAASLGLLEQLVAEAERDPMLVVATVRDAPRERGDPLAAALARLGRSPRALALALAPLTRGDVGVWLERKLGRAAPADLTSELYARTEGIPLFLREAVRLLEERGDLRHPERIPQHGVTLPAHAFEWIRRACDTLSERTAQLVAAAAVIGREFPLGLAAEAAGIDPEAALDALDEAAGAGVVERASRTDGAAGSARFVHTLFREASYDGLPAGERARLHRRVGEALERRHAGDPERAAAEIAHHHHRALPAGDPARALDWSLRAAEQARRQFDDERAARHLAQAVDALDQQAPVDALRRLETLIALGEAWGRAGLRDPRRAACRSAMAAARALGRPADLARAAIAFCNLSEWADPDAETRQVLAEAQAGIAGTSGLEALRLEVRVAHRLTREELPEAQAAARAALEQARALGDPEALSEALYTLHFALAGPDHQAERAALVREMARSAGASADARDVALIGLVDAASDAIALGDAPAARAFRADAGHFAGLEPPPRMGWHLRVYDTGLALLEGRLHDADALAQSALVLGRRVQHPYAVGCFNAYAIDAARERGDEEAVAARLEVVLERGAPGPMLWLKAFLARAELRLGRSASARARFEELALLGFAELPRGIRWSRTLLEIAHLCADLGEASQAGELAALLDTAKGQHGVLPVPICYGGPLAFAQARLAELRGAEDEALERYEAARDASAALGARPCTARVDAAWGALLGRCGERRAADARLQAARRAALELGLAGIATGSEG